MSTPKYRLVYYNVRALAEPIRWIFHYTGTPFIDERLPWDYPKWFNETKKEFANTVGQIPVFHEEGRNELSQSQVISRYLAKKLNLTGDDDWEDARVDEVISLVYDLFICWRDTGNFVGNPERKNQLKTMLDQKFELFYAKLNKILEESEGDFVLGKKLTHADFWLASLVSIWDDPMTGNIKPIIPDGVSMLTEADLYVDKTKEFPALRKHKEKVTSIPQINNWIQQRPKTIS